MSYYRPDGIEAFAAPDGGFNLLVTRGGRIYERHIGPDDFVTQIEAGVILRPQVSRVAVYKWTKSHKLKADLVDGLSMIRLSRLRALPEDERPSIIGGRNLSFAAHLRLRSDLATNSIDQWEKMSAADLQV